MRQDSIKNLLESINIKLDSIMRIKEQHQDFIPYEKAMDILDCSRQTLDRMRSDNLLSIYKLRGKGRLYIKRSELMELMDKEVTTSSLKAKQDVFLS